MITDFNQLDLTKQYSYADYLTWKFTDRVELIRGWIKKMSPAPSSYHQVVSGNLSFHIQKYLYKKECKVFVAPFDVRLINTKKSSDDNIVYTVVQPDICIICDKDKIDKRGCVGAPDLVIEIVSKGNTKYEMETKFELYEEAGVLEYWIVGLGDETTTVFDLKENKFQFRKIYSNDDKVPMGIFTDFSLDMTEVFE
jgi:Uma2 family endonuclease